MINHRELTDSQLLQAAKEADSSSKVALDMLNSMSAGHKRTIESLQLKTEQQERTLKDLRDQILQREQACQSLINDNQDLRRSQAEALQSLRRLFLSYCTLLKNIEDQGGASIGIEQRLDAAILARQTGAAIGETADIESNRLADFRRAFGQDDAFRDPEPMAWDDPRQERSQSHQDQALSYPALAENFYADSGLGRSRKTQFPEHPLDRHFSNRSE